MTKEEILKEGDRLVAGADKQIKEADCKLKAAGFEGVYSDKAEKRRLKENAARYPQGTWNFNGLGKSSAVRAHYEPTLLTLVASMCIAFFLLMSGHWFAASGCAFASMLCSAIVLVAGDVLAGVCSLLYDAVDLICAAAQLLCGTATMLCLFAAVIWLFFF